MDQSKSLKISESKRLENGEYERHRSVRKSMKNKNQKNE